MMVNLIEALKDYLTLIIFISGIVVATVTSRLQVSSRLKRLEEHAEDNEKHWTTEKKYTVFMPRVEIEQRFENMERILERIDKKLDK